MVSRSDTGSGKRRGRKDNVIPFPNRFSKIGNEQLSERKEVIIEDFRLIRNAVIEIGKTANNALYVAENNGRFPDKAKARRIAYSLHYLKNTMTDFIDRLEKVGDENDMEAFTSIIKSPAVADLLVMAWEQCREGKDERIKERYELITGEDGLKDLAKKYNIKIKAYSKISKADAGVDDIKKIEPDLTEPPRFVSTKKIKEMLERYIGKIDNELEKMLAMPEELLVRKGKGYFIFYDKEDSKAVKMIRAFFGESGEKAVDVDAGYCMMMQESGSHTYISFLDTSRRIAVKSTVFSMHENKGGWNEFRAALKDTLEAAKKVPKKEKKTFIVNDTGMRKRLDLSKLKKESA